DAHNGKRTPLCLNQVLLTPICYRQNLPAWPAENIHIAHLSLRMPRGAYGQGTTETALVAVIEPGAIMCEKVERQPSATAPRAIDVAALCGSSRRLLSLALSLCCLAMRLSRLCT